MAAIEPTPAASAARSIRELRALASAGSNQDATVCRSDRAARQVELTAAGAVCRFAVREKAGRRQARRDRPGRLAQPAPQPAPEPACSRACRSLFKNVCRRVESNWL